MVRQVKVRVKRNGPSIRIRPKEEYSLLLQPIRVGYKLELSLSLPQRFFFTQLPRDQIRKQAMLELTSQWEVGQVIVPVPEDQKSQGFYSNAFLVQKPSGKVRMIINLSFLNKFLVFWKFCMEISTAECQYDYPRHSDA